MEPDRSRIEVMPKKPMTKNRIVMIAFWLAILIVFIAGLNDLTTALAPLAPTTRLWIFTTMAGPFAVSWFAWGMKFLK